MSESFASGTFTVIVTSHPEDREEMPEFFAVIFQVRLLIQYCCPMLKMLLKSQ